MYELAKKLYEQDIKINPNAKFLALRKQVQDKRKSGQNFKSADFSYPESDTNKGSARKDCNHVEDETASHQSPSNFRSTFVYRPSNNGSSMPFAEFGAVANSGHKKYSTHDLLKIVDRTRGLLDGYKRKEKMWENEK